MISRHRPKSSTDSMMIRTTGFLIGLRLRSSRFGSAGARRGSRCGVRSVDWPMRAGVSFVGPVGFGTGGRAADPSAEAIGGGSKNVGDIFTEEPAPGRGIRPEPRPPGGPDMGGGITPDVRTAPAGAW